MLYYVLQANYIYPQTNAANKLLAQTKAISGIKKNEKPRTRQYAL